MCNVTNLTMEAQLLSLIHILLYLDGIQSFNKKQQQSLLEHIENGKITLIASTTENQMCIRDRPLHRVGREESGGL